jgi:glutamate N-acetyltransferase/amino-acid N-acetyltransferase
MPTDSHPVNPISNLHLNSPTISWGRILAATGSVPLSSSTASQDVPVINPTKVSVTFIPSDGTAVLPVLLNGEPEKVDEDRAKQILSKEDINIVVDLGLSGDGEATYWTCDFSYVSSYLHLLCLKGAHGV